MVRHLRTFERKKQRCLGAIAKAPVSALGRGENAMKARKLAAESETAAAGNIIGLEELAKL